MSRTTRALRLAALAALVGVGNLLEGAKLRLFTNAVMFTDQLAPADLDEATFTGYAAANIAAWGAPFVDPQDGVTKLVGTSSQFTQTSNAVVNTVTGWYVTNTAGTEILAGDTFAEPIPFNGPNTAIIVNPVVPYPS